MTIYLVVNTYQSVGVIAGYLDRLSAEAFIRRQPMPARFYLRTAELTLGVDPVRFTTGLTVGPPLDPPTDGIPAAQLKTLT